MGSQVRGPFGLNECKNVGNIITANTATEDVVVLNNSSGNNCIVLRNSGGSAVIRLKDSGGSTQTEMIANSANNSYMTCGLVVGSTSGAGSAKLDVSSISKGFLVPRMTTAQRTAIGSPAQALLVYDTDLAKFCYFQSPSWYSLDSTVI